MFNGIKSEKLLNILLRIIEKKKRRPDHPFFYRLGYACIVEFFKTYHLWSVFIFYCNHRNVCYISVLQYHWILKHNFFPVSLYKIKHLRHSLKWAPRTRDPGPRTWNPRTWDPEPRIYDPGPMTHDPGTRTQDLGTQDLGSHDSRARAWEPGLETLDPRLLDPQPMI